MDNLVISDLGILETITKKREKRMGTKVKNVGNYDLKWEKVLNYIYKEKKWEL